MPTPNADAASWKLIFRLAARVPPSSNTALLRVILEVQRTETLLFFAINFMMSERIPKSKGVQELASNFPQKSFLGTKQLI